MAISYPRQLPDWQFESVSFQIYRSTLRTLLRSGAAQRVEIAPPRWVARYRTWSLTNDEFDEVTTFLDTLQGGLKTVRAGDPTRAYPAAHPEGKGLADWNGEGTLSARGANQLRVDTPRPALELSVGDHVGLHQGSNFALHRVTEAASANSSGSLAVSVEPAVLTNVFDVGATVDFYKPRALFALDPDSVAAEKAADYPGISFSLVQVLF